MKLEGQDHASAIPQASAGSENGAKRMEMNQALAALNQSGEWTSTGVVTTGGTLPYTGNVSSMWNGYPNYYYVTQPQTLCSGDIHVFPCPHCDKCKCGAATVKRVKR